MRLSSRFWITLAIFLALGCGIAGFWFWLYNRQLSEAEIGRVLDRYRSELGAMALAVPAGTSGSRERDVALSRINQFMLEKEIFEKFDVYGPDGKLLAHREMHEVQRLDPNAPEGVGLGIGQTQTQEHSSSPLQLQVPLASGGAITAEMNQQLLQGKVRALRNGLARKVASGGLVSLGLLLGLFIFTLILTERLHREKQARIAAEELSSLGQLAAGLAHEIKNPLNALSLNLQLLEEEMPAAQRVGEPQVLLEAMRGEINRLDALARDFLLYAKPLTLKTRPVAIEPLLRELRRLLQPLADERRVTLQLEVEPGLAARADEALTRQAALNLLLNALHFAPPGTQVTLAAARAGRRVVIRVEDLGPGVAPELREKIFSPFFSTREGGTGLGLAISSRIATAHNGELSLLPQPDGSPGARFQIALPGVEEVAD